MTPIHLLKVDSKKNHLYLGLFYLYLLSIIILKYKFRTVFGFTKGFNFCVENVVFTKLVLLYGSCMYFCVW